MHQLLKKAIAEVNQLPAAEQEVIAALILQELADEHRWTTAFANSQDQLSELADRVRGDIKAGRVKEMGFDQL